MKKQPSGCFFYARSKRRCMPSPDAPTLARFRAKLHNQHALIRAVLRLTCG
jgi:hypothetical protein